MVDSRAYVPDSDADFRLQEVQIQKSGTPLHVAFAQIRSPLPSGKTAVALHGRESFEWTSLEEQEARISKACQILDFIADRHPYTDIVIFPEYSIPVEAAIPRLKPLADRYELVVVPGADNVRESDTGLILNKSPILVPGLSEVVWSVKRRISPMEVGYVDEPSSVSNPILYWDVEGGRYYVSISICMDFTLSVRDRLPDEDRPVIHLVPMCSRDMLTFRTYADTLLGEQGGRAVFLCNAVGQGAAGASSVFALTIGGARLIPAVQMSEVDEELAIVCLDCAQLHLPKRTALTTKPPIREVHRYGIRTSTSGIAIEREAPVKQRPRSRAVVNPYLFNVAGKKLGVMFVGVDEYGKVLTTNVDSRGFEAYSVLGPSDMMITHLHQDVDDMIYDISEAIPWRLPTGERNQPPLDPSLATRFPHFAVTGYHKVLGATITAADRAAFDEMQPTYEEMESILRLGSDWNTAGIARTLKAQFLDNRWILGETTAEPGEIDAVMTLYLDHSDGIARMLQTFDDHVLPELQDLSEVTSIFSGTGQRMQIHYLLRITSSVDALFTLIERIHTLATKHRLMLATHTYVIVKKWSHLSLETVLLPELPHSDTVYRNRVFLDKLKGTSGTRFASMPENYQVQAISRHKEISTCLRALRSRDWFKELADDFDRHLVSGLADEEFSLLKLPHEVLQGRTERVLSDLAVDPLEEEAFEALKKAAGILAQKSKTQLSYTDKVKLAIEAARQHLIAPSLLPDFQTLYESTIQVRNALSHDDFERVTGGEFVQAMCTYCRFLAQVEAAESEI